MAISCFLAIFAAMKKWLITYLFFVCSICLHAAGFGDPVKMGRTAGITKTSNSVSPRAFIFRKASPALSDFLSTQANDVFVQYGNVRVLYPVVSLFKAESNFFFGTSIHRPGSSISEREVERVLKDHLLHLFPSHYFW